MRLLAVSGSLRTASTDAAALRAAARLAPPGVAVDLYLGLAALPFFDPDLDGDAPPAPVEDLRSEVGRADALLICSPDYARGISGAPKNMLDWLAASAEVRGKPVAVIDTSQRATHADASLRLILDTMSARLVANASITLPPLGRGLNAEGIAAGPDLSGRLRAALDALCAAAGGGDPPRGPPAAFLAACLAAAMRANLPAAAPEYRDRCVPSSCSPPSAPARPPP